MSNLTASDVVDIIDGLSDERITVWLDGGWCVDALVASELRDHDDLDVAVSRFDELACREWFSRRGYAQTADKDASPWNYVLADSQGRRVDVHVFEFDENGTHVYGVEYPAESLTGHAVLNGHTVRCISPEWMFRFKTAYDPAPKDLVDVQALATKFDFEVPLTHRS